MHNNQPERITAFRRQFGPNVQEKKLVVVVVVMVVMF